LGRGSVFHGRGQSSFLPPYPLALHAPRLFAPLLDFLFFRSAGFAALQPLAIGLSHGGTETEHTWQLLEATAVEISV